MKFHILFHFRNIPTTRNDFIFLVPFTLHRNAIMKTQNIIVSQLSLIDDLFGVNIQVRDNAVARAPAKDVSGAENSARVPRSLHRCRRFLKIYSAQQISASLILEIALSDPPSSSNALKINDMYIVSSNVKRKLCYIHIVYLLFL